MAENMKVVQTLDDRDVVAALQRQLDLMTKLERKLEQGGRASKESGQSWIGSLTKVAAGYVSVQAGLNLVINANREIIQQSAEIGKRYDDLRKAWLIQSGLRGLEGDASQTRISEIAERVGVTGEIAQESATRLVTSGFSAADASGPLLEKFLEIAAAGNEANDPQRVVEIASAVSGYLASQGKSKSVENVTDVGARMQAVFKLGNFGLPALPEFAKEGSVFRGKLDDREQFSAMNALMETRQPGEATTALRNIVMSLTSQKLTPVKVKMLDQLGIDPNEIDLMGENLLQVLERWRVALERSDPSLRDSQLEKFFEKANVAAFNDLLANVPLIQKGIAVQGDTSGFESDVALAKGGRNAASNRQQIRRDRMLLDQDQLDDLILGEMENRLVGEGTWAASVYAKKRGFQAARSVGVSPQRALDFVLPFGGGITSDQILDQVHRDQSGASSGGSSVPGQSYDHLTPAYIEQSNKANDEWAASLRENAAASRSVADQLRRRNSGPPPAARLSGVS